MSKQRVILIGRHISELPEEFEVVEQRNITWSTNRQECRTQLVSLWDETKNMEDVSILLQNVPAILALAISDLSADSHYTYNLFNSTKLGVIISVPGERVMGDTIKPFVFSHIEWF